MFLYTFLAIIVCVFLLVKKRNSAKAFSLKERHVIVTGGSSGIGKQVSILAAKHGAVVSIIARDEKKLRDVKEEILALLALSGESDDARINILSLDLTQPEKIVGSAISAIISDVGVEVSVLINCAGKASMKEFSKTPVSDFTRMFEVNVVSAVNATKAVMPSMRRWSGGECRVVFVSSIAGQIGIYGTSAYSASKFALKGLAEALQMELAGSNIRTTLVFPPDTDTPGFHEESIGKPEITQKICGSASVWSSDSVAANIINSLITGEFAYWIGFEGFLAAQATAGMSPVKSSLRLLLQLVLMTPCRLISLCYIKYFNYLIEKELAKKTLREIE